MTGKENMFSEMERRYNAPMARLRRMLKKIRGWEEEFEGNHPIVAGVFGLLSIIFLLIATLVVLEMYLQ